MRLRNKTLPPLTVALCVAFLTACKPGLQNPDTRGEFLVRVGDSTLTRENLAENIPAGLPEADSARQARAFIRSWIETQLISQAAGKSLINNEEIERMVEDYRRDLIAREYFNRYYSAATAKGFPADSVTAYYQKHKDLFLLERPVVRGIYVKVPAKHPRLNEIRKLMASGREADVDKLEKAVLSPEIHYDYFRDRWVDLQLIESKIPVEINATTIASFRNKGNITLNDNDFIYLLKISDFIDAGETAPREFADEKIRTAMEFERRGELERTLQRDLLQQARNRGEIEINCDLAPIP